jgi:hypothetical protein
LEEGREKVGEAGAATPWPFLYPYSPECVEGLFSEVRLEGVLVNS